MNYKGGTKQAYNVFREDLKKDRDFIEYKKGCEDLGALVVGNCVYMLEGVYFVNHIILSNFINNLRIKHQEGGESNKTC